MDSEDRRSEDPAAAATIAPLAFAIGIVLCLIGLIVSIWVTLIGAALAAIAGWKWTHANSTADSGTALESDPAPETAYTPLTYERSGFLSIAAIGLGALVGAIVALPAAALMIVPTLQHRRRRHVDLGPMSNFPEGRYVATTFELDPAIGVVSRRTAFVRYNGLLDNEPSFTIISNRCTHVGCPTQPNGPLFTDQTKNLDPGGSPVRLIPVEPAGFGCPCHGSQFDREGNRVAGPAVRALDRFEYEIDRGSLVLTGLFSVARVDGAGSDAKIHRTNLAYPGEPVTGLESLLYPIQPPTN
jgi:menaquinol-cytochrome c reductase iron-sulfur subunit